MIRFRPMYVDVSVVVSAAPVRRTKARAKASVASSEIRTTKGVSFRGFVTSFFRIPERSSTCSPLSPVSTFRTMPSSTFKPPTTDEAAGGRRKGQFHFFCRSFSASPASSRTISYAVFCLKKKKIGKKALQSYIYNEIQEV